MSRLLPLVILILSLSFPAQAKINVITATQDLAWLTARVGGEFVKVESLSTGNQDLHLVEPRPSMVVKLRKADMVVRIGMDLDMWMDSLIATSRNKNIMYGAEGHVDASGGIEKLQVPVDKVDGSMGDIHIYGNPHYWLDPANAEIMTKNILDGLVKASPENGKIFQQNREEFIKELKKKLAKWEKQLARFKGSAIVTYHNSWVYFAERFGLKLSAEIEPKPGIPPSPSHLEKLIEIIKKEKVRVIMAEKYFPVKGPRMIAEKTGAVFLQVPSSIGGIPEIKTYFDLFDYVVGKLAEKLERK
jgi:ABC-type Zn uptake system ZnuABC Zn-binding protein ZnuA